MFQSPWFGRLSRFSLSLVGNYSDQSRQGNDGIVDDGLDVDESTFTSVRLGLQRPLARNLTANADASWHEQDPKGDSSFGVEAETWIFGLGVSRTITDRLSASLRYNFADRSSDVARDEYQENRITLSVRASLL